MVIRTNNRPVVPYLSANPQSEYKADLVMVGVGLSSCSLVLALIEAGYPGEIVMLEQANVVNTNKTWCYWSDQYMPRYLSPLVSKRWRHWRVAETKHSVSNNEYGYHCIKAADFFDYCFKRFANHGKVTMFFNKAVDDFAVGTSTVTVRSDDFSITATHGFDSRPPPLTNVGRGSLLQCFTGAWVESTEPIFCPQTAHLMADIKTVGDAIQFIYILPLSRREALIEVTQFSPKAESLQHLKQMTLEVLDTFGLGHEAVTGWEGGILPMTNHIAPTIVDEQGNNTSNQWRNIGIRGNCIRAATGYAFSKIQQDSLRIARQITGHKMAAYKEKKILVNAGLYTWLDSIFLMALTQRPELAPEVFKRMARGTTGEQFARFMTERASALDLLKVISSMPKRAFVRAAWETMIWNRR
ncbi:lycopene cyclase family protein [Vibrio sp. nBUS_14]|uniref:lycopene cyclase family protein n=1 Tax=Vibrio sp. nBUS_14 TaxID=3395321 RepID=UPI003EBF2ADC